MDIYLVEVGDTIELIAKKYDVSVEKLINDNNFTDPYNLVPGESVVIAYPSKTYTVREGDTLDSIASINDISLNELLRNNPVLIDDNIYPGEVLTISYNRDAEVYMHGYTSTIVDRRILRKNLPYLTYLSIINYTIVKNGEIFGSEDDRGIIQLAEAYGVIPIMHLASLTNLGEIDLEITNEILTNEELQDKLFNSVLQLLKEKGYYGVNISAQYISSANSVLFNNYAKRLSDLISSEGYLTFITINPVVATSDEEDIYENIDYTSIGSTVDTILFMQYRWGLNELPPAPIVSIINIDIFIDYVLSQVPGDKIYSGIPTFGYIWELPYIRGVSEGNSITIDNAINLARNTNSIIQFDEFSQTPYFITETGSDSIVYFVNAITVDSHVSLLLENGIKGVGIWNVMIYFAQLWLVINSQYKIVKLLPEY